jgi:hypothetical protein
MDVLLLIIYNHRYDKNIPVLRDMYSQKFTDVLHLVPFYDGTAEDVIPVYESSFYFHGYIAQAAKFVDVSKYQHIMVIADDLILNPAIDSNSYLSLFGLQSTSAFIPHLISFQETQTFWPRMRSAVQWTPKNKGAECQNELPSPTLARQAFDRLCLSHGPVPATNLVSITSARDIGRFLFKMSLSERLKWFHYLIALVTKKKIFLRYPLIGGYSDIFIIPAMNFRRFAHLCGVFAATELFVEIAIPSAIALTADDLVTEDKIHKKGVVLWPNGWVRLDGSGSIAKDDELKIVSFENKLEALLSNFPPEWLYVHPIKISKWL